MSANLRAFLSDGGFRVSLLVTSAPEPWMQLLLMAQHFLIGWASAVPLLAFWLWRSSRAIRLGDGLIFGAVYYVAVNALALRWVFGDPFPWQLGWPYIYPTLVVHLVFGISIALTARDFWFALKAPKPTPFAFVADRPMRR